MKDPQDVQKIKTQMVFLERTCEKFNQKVNTKGLLYEAC
jgi:hypothetical protein